MHLQEGVGQESAAGSFANPPAPTGMEEPEVPVEMRAPASGLPPLPVTPGLSHTRGDLTEHLSLRVQALSTLTPKHSRAPEGAP